MFLFSKFKCRSIRNYFPILFLFFYHNSVAQQKIPVAAMLALVTESCDSTMLRFTNNSTDAKDVQWKLTGPQSSNSNENIFTFYFTLPGKYILTLLAENIIGKDSTYLDVVINPLPVVSIHTTPLSNPKSNDAGLVTEVKGGTSPYAFSWSNGSTIANQQNIFAGNYEVTVTDYKGCMSVASTTILIGSGELNLFHTAGINIYPYTSEHKIDVEWIKHFAKIEFVVLNFTGQIIKQYQYIETDNGSMTFNNMAGFYVLKIITDEEVMIQKFIF